MLFQVFTNLFYNAIKYTHHQGTITVRSEQFEINDDINNRKYVQIDISDSGIGISRSERMKVVEPFYHLEKIVFTKGMSLFKTGIFTCKIS